MNTLRTVLQLCSWLACGMTLLAPLGFLFGWVGSEAMKGWLLAATLVWFGVTPWWMGRRQRRMAPRGSGRGAVGDGARGP